MKIFSNSTQFNFKSLNNPVKPYVIKTRVGNLSCAEIPAKQLYNSKKLEEISHLFCRNFATLTKDPYWLEYNDSSKREYIARNFMNYIKGHLLQDDGDLTMLVAKDENDKIQAACFSYAYSEISNKNNSACYIDSLAVNPEYRECGVGKELLNKTCEINKNNFTDVFLTGEVLAKEFYEKAGFIPLDEKEAGQRYVTKFLEYRRGDEMEYLIPFNKPLQEDKPRWFLTFV